MIAELTAYIIVAPAFMEIAPIDGNLIVWIMFSFIHGASVVVAGEIAFACIHKEMHAWKREPASGDFSFAVFVGMCFVPAINTTAYVVSWFCRLVEKNGW